MRFQVAFLLILLCEYPVFLQAQKQQNLYVWNRAGEAVYAALSASTVIDTLQYGRAVYIIEVREEIIIRQRKDYRVSLEITENQYFLIEVLIL